MYCLIMKVKRSEQRLRRRGSQDTPGGMVLPKLRPRRPGWQRLRGAGVWHAGLSAGSPKPEPANFSGCWGGRVYVGTTRALASHPASGFPDLFSFVSRGGEGGALAFPGAGSLQRRGGATKPKSHGSGLPGVQGDPGLRGGGGLGAAGRARPSSSLSGRRGGSLSP